MGHLRRHKLGKLTACAAAGRPLCCGIWDGWVSCGLLDTAFVDLTCNRFCHFRVADVLQDLGRLEILQAPGLPYIIPREYAELPHLTGTPVHLFMSVLDLHLSSCHGGPWRWAIAAKASGHKAPHLGVHPKALCAARLRALLPLLAAAGEADIPSLAMDAGAGHMDCGVDG